MHHWNGNAPYRVDSKHSAAPRPINENAHSSGWTGGAVEAVVAGRAGAAA
jgi:hypothetical protein